MTKTRRKTKEIEVFKTLEIIGEFTNSSSFYTENRRFIFDSVIELYNELLITGKEQLKLDILVNLDGETGKISWSTAFLYDKKNINVLINDILPFYESIEEYEKCETILKLYNDFTK